MYRHLEALLLRHVREFLTRAYGLDLQKIVIEQPPKVELGEYALPLAFELAKKLRKAPRKIAEEIVAGLGPVPGFEKFEIAGAGYINARVRRDEMAAALVDDLKPKVEIPPGKVLVEHSSINPNKAAHVGHLRNAILGDTFVRLLRFAGREVDVQNYIDNTGVQVADVIVGLVHIKKWSTLAEVKEHLARVAVTDKQYAGPDAATDELADVLMDSDPSEDEPKTEDLPPDPLPVDYYLWDLYARVTGWYEFPAEKEKRKLLRGEVLHAIEQGDNELAKIAEFVSTAVLRRHLETMDRLDIEYDFLPRESEILHLHFWDAAFTKLKDGGVLFFETEGKNKGCWVMRRAGTSSTTRDTEITEEDQKVIVRSNGTVGYVGKDIAYHLWKFGLLGRDFGYRKFYRYPNGHDCWISTAVGALEHPHFGDVAEIYNVIDARQSEAQNTVIEALRGLGYNQQADHYTHFSYEMVALTPRCAAELGYVLSEEDKARSYIEVSGRKGFGVKADDLIDRLIGSARQEVDSRHPQLSDGERANIASQIAVGALRYFMLKFTKSSVIAFDFKEALSFEGETGPYVQYAVVRAANIFRKGGLDPDAFLMDAAGKVSPDDLRKNLTGEGADEIWELWLTASKTSYIVDQCIDTAEPAYLAKHAFQLAQLFNYFYHRHPILNEADESRKKFLLATTAVVRRELLRALAIMGISVPPVM